MKRISKIVIGIVIVSSLTAMSDVNIEEVSELRSPLTESECTSTYTICDNYINYLNKSKVMIHELEFKFFDRCMTSNGC